jgi:hypothetical protein
MKFVLQSFETGLYLDTTGDWTNRPELARDFPNALQVSGFKLQRRLRDVFVVVVPEPPRWDEPAVPWHGADTHAPEPASRIGGWTTPSAPHVPNGGRIARGIRR